MFSIIIPTLNEEKFLPKLLASLAAQTDKNFEVIVVDGSSKDKTVAVAKTFAKKLPKLKIIVSKKASLPLQRNVGAKAARGAWLFFIDADSVLFPYSMDRCRTYINTHNVSIFTSWSRPDSETQGDANINLFWMIILESSIKYGRQLAPGPFSAVRRDVFDKVGGYDEAHSFHEDVDFSLRVYRAGHRLKIIRETLYVLSLRRFRKQGTLKVIQQYIRATLPIILFKRPLNSMPNYIMGGHVYGKKKKMISSSTLKKYERSLKKLLKDIFE